MTKSFTLNNSRSVIGFISGLKSRIIPMKPLFSRYCMFTVVIMLLLGGFSTSAWGGTTETTKTNVEGVWYSLYTDTEYYFEKGGLFSSDKGTKNKEFSVVPPTDGNVSFEWRKSQSGAAGSYNGYELNVSYSNNGSDFTGETRVVTSKISEKWADWKPETKEISGSSNAVKVKFSFGSCTRTNYYRNVKVKMAAHILLDNSDAVGVTSKSGTLANTVYGNTSAAYHIDLRSFLMTNSGTSRVLKYQSSNGDFHFGSGDTVKTYTLKNNACAFDGGTANCASSNTALGDPDDYEADVYFTPRTNKNGSSSTTITIYDGATARATITLTAKVIPTYYFKATAVATDGSSTLDIPVRASYTSGSYSASTASTSVTAATADVASLTKTAYYYAPASSGDYQFQGWYKTAACNGTRISTENTISCTITSNSLNSASPVDSVFYAKYLQEIRAEFTGSDQTLNVDGSYDGIGYTRTSAETASDNPEDSFWYEIIVDEISDVTTGSVDDDAVIAYNPSTKVVTAINAGTARLILHQEATGYYVDVDKTYTFTVNKYVTTLDGYVEPMLVDATPQIVSYLRENTSAEYPSEGDSNDFFYTINHTLHTPTVVTGCADGHEADVIGYTPSTHTITAYNAGTAKLTIAQKETYKYTGDTLELNVTVSKHDPVFTWHAPEHYYYNSTVANIFTTTGTNDTTVRSDNPAVRVVANTLYISPTFDETHITLTQAENYYWNYKEEIVTFTPEKQENHLPITSLTKTNASTYSVSMSGEATWETKGGKSVMTFGNGKWYGTRPEGYAVFTFTGIPDTLKFTTFCTDYLGQYPAKEDYMFEVYESPDNSSWSLRWQCDNTNGYKDSDNKNANRSLSLSPTTRYIKLRYHGACWGHFSDIQVTEKYQFVANEGEKIFDFGSKGAKYGLQEERLIFDHANAGSMTRAELISGADAAKFTVSPTTITGTGRDKSGSFVLSVSFDNDDDTGREDSDYTAKLRIYDNRGNADTVTLKGHRWGLTAPEFTWNQHHMPYYHNTTISNVVISTNTDYEKCPFTYESTDDDIAYVDEAGTLHIGEKSGSVTITVSQKEGNNYSELEKTFTFTPLVAPSLKVPFYLDSTIYTSGSVAIADGTTGAWDSESANDIRLGDGNVSPSSWGTKVFVIAFSDAPDKVSFRYKTNSTKTSRGWNRLLDLLGAPMWTIEESATGGTWDTVWNETSNSDFWKYETVQLSPRTQYVRFTYNGNGYGYFGNIQVTALDGYHFMRTKDGKYLSRGGKYGTQAVLDEIGVAVRVTRYTLDNVHDTTLVQFVDSREFLFENIDEGTDEVYTDNGSRTSMKWKQIRNADTLIVQSMNGSGKYITLVGDTLKMTNDLTKATKWIPESATVRYNKVSTKLGKLAASAASCEFGAGENTLESVRRQISQNDYDKIDIPIPHLNDKVYEANVSGEGREAAGMWKVYSDTIGGLIPGFYRLTVQAMYQTGADPIDWENNQLGVESQIAYVHANDGFYPVKSRYDIDGRNYGAYETGTSISKDALTYYPDDATAAGEAFATASKYMNDVYAYVGEDSTLIYGIKNPSYVPGERLFYKNFTLTRIARKEYVYKEEADEVWNDLSNWEYKGGTPGSTPTINHKVTIKSDITIDGELTAYSLDIDESVTVTIAPTGGLTVGAGGISGADAEHLILKAGTAGDEKCQTGYLRISPEYDGDMPEAKVEMYTIAYHNKNAATGSKSFYQCMGAPISDAGVMAKTVFGAGSYLYTWNESTEDWTNSRTSLEFTPFKGFEVTQKKNSAGLLYTHAGHIVSGSDVKTIDLEYTSAEKGYNLLANSWTAPIDISQFESDDFVDANSTIYILNAGTKNQSDAQAGGNDAPGKWIGVPIKTAAELAADGLPRVISSMQGFWVKANSGSAQLKLDYSRLVWGVNYSGYTANKPLRVQQRDMEEEDESRVEKMKINIYGAEESDVLYMLESNKYDKAYEDGYDAYKVSSEGLDLYSIEEDAKLSVDATYSISGTALGLRTGDETAYTFRFTRVTADKWALWDIETGQKIDINEGAEYTFFTEPDSEINDRFMIIEREEGNNTTTQIENTNKNTKGSKFIKNDCLYILKDGKLYDTLGRRVR